MLQVDTGQKELIVEEAGNKISKLIAKVDALEGFTVREIANNLRAYEGNASKEYFRALNQFIPRNTGSRSAHNIRLQMLPTPCSTTDTASCMERLRMHSYAAARSDIGILHRDEYGRPVLSYDVIELYRVWIDYIVYSLLAQNIITDDYYSRDERGAVWLEALGRRVIIQSVNDYLSENESIKGMTRSRETQYFSICKNSHNN